LAEDHRIVRQGIKALLATEPDFRVVGETGDGLEAVELIERLRPNIAVLDLMMPSLGGLEVARAAKSRAPQTRVLVLSMHANEAYVLEALRAGALGYVVKESSSDVLVYAIREVMAGRHYLGPPLSERSLVTYLEKAKAGAETTYQTLTPREREVMRLIAEGYSSPEIAERLVLSPRTVETHRANLMQKLKLRSTADLIRYAIRHGILPQEEPLPITHHNVVV
jgi:DNA-binding NarL/FixJ family response regulator